MAKIKPLLPSLRERKRYIVYEIISKDMLLADIDDIEEAIEESTMEYLGIMGMAEAGIMVLKDKYKDQKGIIRVTHKSVENVKAALIFMKEIKDQEVIVRTIGVSGIMKKAYNYVSK